MLNKQVNIHVTISVLVIVSALMANDRFPLYDPKNEVLNTIVEGSSVAYCLIHIEKGKKFEAKEEEPDSTQKINKINSSEWFREQRPSLKLNMSTSAKADVNNKNQNIGKGRVKAGDIKIPVHTDEEFMHIQHIKEDKSIFKPEYNTITADTEGVKVTQGYGVINDCYFINEQKEVKRQVRYMFCDASNSRFIIRNYRMVSDGGDEGTGNRWVDTKIGLKLADFDEGGDRFYIGPLSFYADGYMDIEQENECTLRIKSNTFHTVVTTIILLFVVFVS